MSAVIFDFGTWILRYPEFDLINPALAQMYFDEAGLYCDNTAASLITDMSTRTMLLGMVTAHLATLNNPKRTIVGRIANGTEGSVTVGIENQYPPGSAQWFQQTKYGASFWAASAQWRVFQYVTGTPRNMDAYAATVVWGVTDGR